MCLKQVVNTTLQSTDANLFYIYTSLVVFITFICKRSHYFRHICSVFKRIVIISCLTSAYQPLWMPARMSKNYLTTLSWWLVMDAVLVITYSVARRFTSSSQLRKLLASRWLHNLLSCLCIANVFYGLLRSIAAYKTELTNTSRQIAQQTVRFAAWYCQPNFSVFVVAGHLLCFAYWALAVHAIVIPTMKPTG